MRLLALSGLAALALAGTSTTQCSATGSGPGLTMQFTPTQPVQQPPISTVYGAIITSYLNVVDCRWIMVENVDDNKPVTGAFTARATSSALTVYHVGCMSETSQITRRDMALPTSLPTSLPNPSAIRDVESSATQHTKVVPRASLEEIANKISTGVDPMNDNITVRDFRFLREINTALFALNIVNAHLPLNETCQELQNATVQDNLDNGLIDAKQAANIVCFAEQYGLFFNASFAQILSDLAALEYAIQMSAYNTQTLDQVCSELDYSAASFLGIDVEGIRNDICKGAPGRTQPTPTQSPSPSMQSNHTTTTSPSGPPQTTSSNATNPEPGPFGTGSMISSAASAAGTVAPWFNFTVTSTSTGDSITVTEVSPQGGSQATSVAPGLPFYYPPQIRRAAIRRHGRDML